MGRRLGRVNEEYDPFKNLSMYDAFVVRQAGIYPTDSLISHEDWMRIYNYYLEESPEVPLPVPSSPETLIGLPGFNTRVINDLPAYPLSTMVKIDSIHNQLYWGSRAGDLMVLNRELNLVKQFSLESPPSQVLIESEESYVVTMGIMDPSEEAKGEIKSIQGRKVTTLFAGLQRPVHLTLADLDENGSNDYLVSEFGNQTGSISWFRLDKNGQHQEAVLKNVPGAVSSEVIDLNTDGRKDIVTLFGQGDERISVFLKQKDGSFRENILLRFPPVYGSTSFQLIDFNNDGLKDILYTNGDNADYSFSLKGFHGARIFINKGDLRFEESFFYPMYGATKSLAHDFDQDGDLDMVVISFFPDFDAKRPEGFVYLQNQGGMEYKAYTFLEAANGRWLVMDIGDYDGDGDKDIVLGSLLFKISAAPQQTIENWIQNGYQMVVLENTVGDTK